MNTLGEAKPVLRRAVDFTRRNEGSLAEVCRVLITSTCTVIQQTSHIHGGRQAIFDFADTIPLLPEAREHLLRLQAWLDAALPD